MQSRLRRRTLADSSRSDPAGTATRPKLPVQLKSLHSWAQSGLPIQFSLKVNTPGDRYEQEADRIANQIIAPAANRDPQAGHNALLNSAPAAHIQREEKDQTGDVITEGASLAYEHLEDQPGFATWQEQQTDRLKLKLWENQPTEVKAGLISFGLLNLGLLGTVFAADPTMRSETIDFLQDKNLLLPTKLIPYSKYFPVSSFKYKLPAADAAPYTFETEFSFDAWFELMQKKWHLPKVSFSAGVESAYSAGVGFTPFTGGNFRLRFGGGIIDLSAFHHQALPPTPMLIDDPAGGSPAWLMRSLPSQLEGNLPLGSGIFLKVDIMRIPELINPPVKKPAATIRRRPSGGGNAPAAAPPIVQQTLSQPGLPLDNATRHFMQARFGHDFSAVRVHTSDTAAASAESVRAQAYTHGTNIVFNQGRYRPNSQDGRRLLAHELAHVIQQQGTPANLVQREGPAEQPATKPAEPDDGGEAPQTALKRRDVVFIMDFEEAARLASADAEFFKVNTPQEMADALKGISFPIRTIHVFAHSSAEAKIKFPSVGFVSASSLAATLKDAIPATFAPQTVDFRGCSVGLNPAGMEKIRQVTGAGAVIGATCFIAFMRLPFTVDGTHITDRKQLKIARNKVTWDKHFKNHWKKFTSSKCVLDKSEDAYLKAGGFLVSLYANKAFTTDYSETSICLKDLTEKQITPQEALTHKPVAADTCRLIRVDLAAQAPAETPAQQPVEQQAEEPAPEGG